MSKVKGQVDLVHVRVSQREPDKVTIEFFDNEGLAISKADGKKN